LKDFDYKILLGFVEFLS